MQKLSLAAFLCIILWGIVGCQNDVVVPTENVPIAIQESATREAMPTYTPVPSATNTATPTFTVTPLPTNTARPQPTATNRPTVIPLTTLVPTLLPATPQTQPSAYQLKEWTEQDALDLVSEMRTRIDPIDWDSGIGYASEIDNFQFSQRPIELAAYEAVLRFPNSTNVEKVRWERLQATALLGPIKTNPSEQIEKLLEEGLNKGAYRPEAWVRRFELYGFSILPVAEVKNLLGDGRIIPIYKIETTFSEGTDGLYFALAVLDNSNFDVIPIVDLWYEGNGFWEGDPSFADRTGDNIPELAISVRFQSGTICATTVLVLQWQENKFVNLAKQPDGQSINLPLCWDDWRFLPREENGAQPIQLHLFHFLSDDSTTWMNQVYVWDQAHYVLRDTNILPISDNEPLEWIDYNVAIGEWETAVQAIDDLLAQWGTNPPPTVDPSYPDFLRFQQGWLYAVNSQGENGRVALQQLIEAPVNPITPTLSLAAQAFLNVYQTDSDIYQACVAAQQLMLNAVEAPTDYSANYLKAWGYTNPNDFPCDLSDAWSALIAETTQMSLDEAATFLEEQGVQLVDKWYRDLDQDGQAEILFTVEKPDFYRAATRKTWAVFETESGLQYVPLGLAFTPATRWEISLPPGSTNPIHFVQDEETLYLIQFTVRENEIIAHQFFLPELYFNVNRFVVTREDNELLLAVDFLPSVTSFRQLTWRWNPVVDDFEILGTDVPYFSGSSRYDLVEWAKVMLLEEQRFEETAVMLSYYTANYQVELPETYYLLALAYELSGQEQQAVATYWQLWRDFPDDSFAIMARRKLVPAEP